MGLAGSSPHLLTFLVGLGGFAAASALGGTAALSLLATTFTEPAERARAFGVYSGVGGAGSALGLIAGGPLTQYGSWRWCLYVPVAAFAAAGERRRPDGEDGQHARPLADKLHLLNATTRHRPGLPG